MALGSTGPSTNGFRVSKEITLGNLLSIIFMVFAVSVWGLRLESKVNENSRDIAKNNEQIYRDMTNQAKVFVEDLHGHENLDAHPNTMRRINSLEIRMATVERDDAVMSRSLEKLEKKLDEFDALLRKHVENNVGSRVVP